MSYKDWLEKNPLAQAELDRNAAERMKWESEQPQRDAERARATEAMLVAALLRSRRENA